MNKYIKRTIDELEEEATAKMHIRSEALKQIEVNRKLMRECIEEEDLIWEAIELLRGLENVD
ncbi:hypothetical protein AXI71_gp27 [Lactococcus phage GE1]|uniref:Uncharacterized protein n=1 Tax=Lactococcus phage GE1 TaxID=1698369 RepID=A0A0N9BAV6_9CAUD|nr:hypothetical protein AXI71_gp27 [Lactococcus phage GE1]ALA06981.1 hypothetical protein [Lactococcus phage GE1]